MGKQDCKISIYFWIKINFHSPWVSYLSSFDLFDPFPCYWWPYFIYWGSDEKCSLQIFLPGLWILVDPQDYQIVVLLLDIAVMCYWYAFYPCFEERTRIKTGSGIYTLIYISRVIPKACWDEDYHSQHDAKMGVCDPYSFWAKDHEMP